MAIANPTFEEPGSTEGTARAWMLRSRASHEAIAAFLPSEGFESFERFSTLVTALDASAERFFFSLAGAEAFEVAWVRVPFRTELDLAERDARVFDGVPVEDLEWAAPIDTWEDAISAAPFADTLEHAWPGTDDFETDLGAVPIELALFDGVASAERFDGVWPEQLGGEEMASTDWTFLDDGLEAAVLARGVTAGFAPPPGGGRFVYGFHSLATSRGAAGLFVNGSDFAPMAKGGSVRACVQRAPSGGDTGFSPMLYLSLQGPSVNDAAYLLGLEAADPHRIVLKKGAIAAGIGDSEGPGVLLRSNESFRDGSWVHLRLDAIVQDTGDVVLNVFRSDLSRHPADAPRWEPISGMPSFIDDALGIHTGSAPLASGRGGFAFFTADVRRRGFFDQLEIIRQL